MHSLDLDLAPPAVAEREAGRSLPVVDVDGGHGHPVFREGERPEGRVRGVGVPHTGVGPDPGEAGREVRPVEIAHAGVVLERHLAHDRAVHRPAVHTVHEGRHGVQLDPEGVVALARDHHVGGPDGRHVLAPEPAAVGRALVHGAVAVVVDEVAVVLVRPGVHQVVDVVAVVGQQDVVPVVDGGRVTGVGDRVRITVTVTVQIHCPEGLGPDQRIGVVAVARERLRPAGHQVLAGRDHLVEARRPVAVGVEVPIHHHAGRGRVGSAGRTGVAGRRGRVRVGIGVGVRIGIRIGVGVAGRDRSGRRTGVVGVGALFVEPVTAAATEKDHAQDVENVARHITLLCR